VQTGIHQAPLVALTDFQPMKPGLSPHSCGETFALAGRYSACLSEIGVAVPQIEVQTHREAGGE
jgi:hypothetical protein